jgi:hypothetical protein
MNSWFAGWLMFGLGPVVVLLLVIEGKATPDRGAFGLAAASALVGPVMAVAAVLCILAVVLYMLKDVARLSGLEVITEATIAPWEAQMSPPPTTHGRGP